LVDAYESLANGDVDVTTASASAETPPGKDERFECVAPLLCQQPPKHSHTLRQKTTWDASNPVDPCRIDSSQQFFSLLEDCPEIQQIQLAVLVEVCPVERSVHRMILPQDEVSNGFHSARRGFQFSLRLAGHDPAPAIAVLPSLPNFFAFDGGYSVSIERRGAAAVRKQSGT
jgi:hypothetical protein